MEIEAPIVTPLNKYYPTALLDESGNVISLAKLIPNGEMLVDNERKLLMLRQAKITKDLPNCQDYGLMSAGADGSRKVVIADGVSNTIAGQSVANLIAHKTMRELNEMDGRAIDTDAVIAILEDSSVLVACRFFGEKFMQEWGECVSRNLHKENVIKNAENGSYGSSTLSFMRLQGDTLDICQYGTGGYLVFRNNVIIASHGNKDKQPAQIAVNRELDFPEIHLKSMKVEKGDIAVSFTDGLFGRGISVIEEFTSRIKKYLETGETIYVAVFKAFDEVIAYDDKTLSLFEVT